MKVQRANADGVRFPWMREADQADPYHQSLKHLKAGDGKAANHRPSRDTGNGELAHLTEVGQRRQSN